MIIFKKIWYVFKRCMDYSSDDFSSWGGGDPSYHTEDLKNIIENVDYVSMNTYPMHSTY